MGVIAAQAAWLLFVVFSLTAPRAPGDESNDDGNAKSARGSGRSKWRRGRRRCLLATARHWGAGAEDGEERRCGAAGDHGGGARNELQRQLLRHPDAGEAERHRGAAAEDGVERRCGAAGEKRWSLYHPVAIRVAALAGGQPPEWPILGDHSTTTVDYLRRNLGLGTATRKLGGSARSVLHEGSARSGLARRKMEKTAAAAATKSLRLEARGL